MARLQLKSIDKECTQREGTKQEEGFLRDSEEIIGESEGDSFGFGDGR